MMTREVVVHIGPANRQQYLDGLLQMDGLSHITEDPYAAYCALSLTGTPAEVKDEVIRRQGQIQEIVESAGITAYDPATAPYSPDTNKTSSPDEVYRADTAKIVGARFFVANNLLPSTGVGVEIEKASRFNRMSVVLQDRDVRVSRMMPHRTIYLGYRDLWSQRDIIAGVFSRLTRYSPGMGLIDGRPVLLGFDGSGQMVDIEDEISHMFPELRCNYNGYAPTLELSAINPELLKVDQ